MAFDKKAWMKVYNKRYKAAPKNVVKRRIAACLTYRERAQLLRDLKDNTPCADCGQSFPHYIMDLDHARGKKIRSVARFGNSSLIGFISELAKCDIVCAICHKIRTYDRNPW